MAFFDPVDNVLKLYNERHDLTQVEISVDKLRPIFEEIGYVDKIVWERLGFKSKHILAQIQTYKGSMGVYAGTGDHACIQISDGLNYCWTRFILCKEMYHCILDKSETNRINNTASLLKLSDYLTNSFLQKFDEKSKAYAPFETEADAEIMAMETLFPYELRSHFCEEYDSGTITARQLSLRFRIPVEYVETAMINSYFTKVGASRTLCEIKF